ncbi:hypothetical protein ACS0TY_027528 [Phlomoides rotata]
MDDLPINYLGLKIGANFRKALAWEGVVEKVEARLRRLDNYFLSFDGRLTLINSVLSNLPTYYLSLYRAPKCILKKSEHSKDPFYRAVDATLRVRLLG